MNKKMHRSNKGFTLVEIMIALAIVSLLMTATAVAFNASMINFRENESMYKAVNAARQTLLRMTAELRTAIVDNEGVQEGDDSSTQCSMITAAGDANSYRYDADAQILYLDQTNGDGSVSNYVMCRNVTAVNFEREIVPGDPDDAIRSVQITITVTSGNVSETLTAAAVLRRNLSS